MKSVQDGGAVSLTAHAWLPFVLLDYYGALLNGFLLTAHCLAEYTAVSQYLDVVVVVVVVHHCQAASSISALN